MTEEEIKALQEAKEAAEAKAQEAANALEAARVEAEKARQDVQKVVDELKEERQKKNEALSKLNINNDEPDVTSLVEQALQKKEQERRATELEEAIAEFKSSKTEFQSDATGVVFDKFKTELGKFNFSDVTTKEQAKRRLEEAYRFVNQSGGEQSENTYEGSPRSNSTPPNRDSELNQSVKNVLDSARINEEKFTKLKGKYPEALEGLGIN
jgi:DNA repair exonuclease SbcCD ATPase subunit